MKPAVEKDTRLWDSFIMALLAVLFLVTVPLIAFACLFTAPLVTLAIVVGYIFVWLWHDAYQFL